MALPADLSVQQVPGSDDLVAFSYDFALGGKAVGDYVSLLENGDLLIEGYASEFEGEDREGENFTDGAFKRGIKSFLGGDAPLCYHHKTSKCLGKVLDLQEEAGKGLKMIARVDGAIRTHPELGTYYEQIKKGTYSGLSVGGFFKRRMTPDGPRISECDFTEISVTPVAVHPKTSFAVVAGKALTIGEADEEEAAPSPLDDATVASLAAALDAFSAALPEGKAAATPKGDYRDLHVLALILALEQFSNDMPENGDGPGEDTDGDSKVDALVTKTKECLDEVAKEAHALAAKLGPLPKISWGEPY